MSIELAAGFLAEFHPLPAFAGLTESHMSVPAASAQDGELIQTLSYRTAQPRRINPQVLAWLIERGAQIVSVTCENSTLEEVYSSAMKGSAEQPHTVSTRSISF